MAAKERYLYDSASDRAVFEADNHMFPLASSDAAYRVDGDYVYCVKTERIAFWIVGHEWLADLLQQLPRIPFSTQRWRRRFGGRYVSASRWTQRARVLCQRRNLEVAPRRVEAHDCLVQRSAWSCRGVSGDLGSKLVERRRLQAFNPSSSAPLGVVAVRMPLFNGMLVRTPATRRRVRSRSGGSRQDFRRAPRTEISTQLL